MKVYVAATRQNDGKTIASIGLIAGLLKKVENIGYIKPVGQHCIEVGGHKVDEDAILVKKIFPIKCALHHMSPVAVPRGFTEAYINNPDRSKIVDQIMTAYNQVAKGKDFVLIEGTGHAGVGSVFDMSNADVAKLLDVKVILVCAGGVGRPIDEVMLNKALFDAMGVEILGVIVNKVQPDKYDKIEPIVRKGFARKGLDVLGVMPYNPLLSSPTIEQLLNEISGTLLTGKRGLNASVERVIIGAMPTHEALDYLSNGTLLVTPGTREDLILAAVSSYAVGSPNETCVSGVVLTGGVLPNKKVMDLISHVHVPIISVPDDTFTAATKIINLMVKIRPSDKEKIAAAEELVKSYVDIDRILDMLS